MAPPLPKDSFPCTHRTPPALSIVRPMPDEVIGLVDHFREVSGN